MLMSVRGALAATLLAGSAIAVATPALADDAAPPSDITVTGSAAIVSQYRFRGISQSDNKPAVQGAITVSHSSGFYVSTWGSSASAGNGAVDIGGTEIDVYGGWTGALGGSGVKLDAGVYGYLYPGAPGGNVYELYGSLAYALGPVTAKAGVNFAPNQKNTSKENTYVYGELSGGIPNTPISIHTHLGHTGGAFNYTKEYLDYSAGVTYTWKNLAFDASIVGTNVSHADAIANPYGGASPFETFRAAKTVGVFSLTASF